MLLPNAPSARLIEVNLRKVAKVEERKRQSMNDGTQARKGKLLAKFGKRMEVNFPCEEGA
ncbi:MAG: hypothetical protein ACTS6H_02170 [Candidatus Hodgkinia cicadicola]